MISIIDDIMLNWYDIKGSLYDFIYKFIEWKDFSDEYWYTW